MVNGTELEELSPRYMTVPKRKGVGISMRCPREKEPQHLTDFGEHRISLWFARPDDEGEPITSEGLWLHLGALEDPRHFSIYAPHGDPVSVSNHWRGWIIEGIVFDASGS